ncbi:MAG: zinc ribbon domain-containing protein [Chitinivibrionales bacterium]|nr:zinc ribbon domain-containing protein [Chitinivibrionales bacterium]
MPLYEYHCKKCNDDFEELVSVSAQHNPACPSCKSEETEKKMSMFGGIGGASGGSCSPRGGFT